MPHRENQKFAINIHETFTSALVQPAGENISVNRGAIFLFSVTDAYLHYLSLSLHFRPPERESEIPSALFAQRTRVFTSFSVSEFILIVTSSETGRRHRESCHRRFMVSSVSALIAPESARRIVVSGRKGESEGERRQKERQTERTSASLSVTRIARFLGAFKGPFSPGSAEGRNGFLGPGYPHRDSRLPTYSDCMRRTVRCSPGSARRHRDRSPARSFVRTTPTSAQMKIFPCLHARSAQPTSRKCVAGFTVSRTEKRPAYPRAALPRRLSCLRGFVNRLPPRRRF